jgi:ABC-type glycerol-3-phosphate transport system substrate-binding protein
MEKKNFFNIILLVVFTLFGVVGIIMFATAGSQSSGGDEFSITGSVVIWGTMPTDVMQDMIDSVGESYKKLAVSYEQKNPETFDDELLDALAAGEGPDLFELADDKILTQKNKIFPIPYESISLPGFANQYVDQAQLYLSPEGSLAFPFAIEPLVLYYNKNILTSSFILNPPEYWDELTEMTSSLASIGPNNRIDRSAIALGTPRNIPHAEEIVALMLLQTGNPLVGLNSANGKYISTFNQPGSDGIPATAVNYFNTFADPSKENYNWNAALPDALSSFLAEDTAFYIGYSTEFDTIRSRNPNLNFAIATVPQSRSARINRGYGKMRGWAISKTTRNIPGAYIVGLTFANPEFSLFAADKIGYASPVRANLSTPKDQPFDVVVQRSAIIAQSWLDPNPEASRKIISDLVLRSGTDINGAQTALTRTHASITSLLRKINESNKASSTDSSS